MTRLSSPSSVAPMLPRLAIVAFRTPSTAASSFTLQSRPLHSYNNVQWKKRLAKGPERSTYRPIATQRLADP